MRHPYTSLLALALVSASVSAQEIHLDDTPRHSGRQRVELLNDNLTVEANRPQEVELRFRIAPNLHINSHTPRDELLLPTTLKFDSGPRPFVTRVDFPAGRPFHLAIGDGEMLDVYQDELRLRIHLAVPVGETKVDGQLRYQACDTASCFPPQTLPVHLTLTAR